MIGNSWSVRAFLLGCVVLSTLAACGGDGGGPVSYVGKETSALIEAKQGGDVALGAVKIAVPAEALEKDTKVSVIVNSKKDYPDRDQVAIDVYELGPKGTSFTKDVELKFDLKGVKVGKNRRARVAELDEEAGAWKTLPDSKVVGGEAVATIKQLSTYTVLVEETPSGGGSYEPIICDADFSPCGGDLTGTWEFTSGCVTGYSQSIPMPTLSGDSCDDAGGGIEVSASGSAHFGTDQNANIDQIVVVTSSFSYPLACLAEISKAIGSPYTCDTIGGTVEGRNCVQTVSSGDIPSMAEGTYSTEGGTLSITPSSAGGIVFLGVSTLNPDIDYCVRGDKLTLRLRDSESGGEPQVYEATRM